MCSFGNIKKKAVSFKYLCCYKIAKSIKPYLSMTNKTTTAAPLKHKNRQVLKAYLPDAAKKLHPDTGPLGPVVNI